MSKQEKYNFLKSQKLGIERALIDKDIKLNSTIEALQSRKQGFEEIMEDYK